MKRYIVSLSIVFILAPFAGCASPATEFYTLSSIPVVERPPRMAGPSVSIVFDPVTIPELVDRTQIVSKKTENRVYIDDFAEWADPLESQIARVLAVDLAQLIPESTVSTSPLHADDDTYRVSIDVQTFDSEMGQSVTIAISWSVKSPAPRKRITGRTVVRELVSAPGYEALVKAHSRALASVATDIATATRSMM
jgi:uncharacterized lipoprotein YmbA